MKLTLTYEFNSQEELLEHLTSQTMGQATVMAAANTAIASDTKKKSPAKKKEAEVEVPTPTSQASEVFPKPPVQPASPIPAAPAAPVQEAPKAPVFDRNVVLAHISSTVNELKQAGYPESKIPTIFVNIFGKMGVPGKKLTDVDDDTLAKFNSHFMPEVANFKQAFGGAVAPTSFI